MVNGATRRSRSRAAVAKRSFWDTVWFNLIKLTAYPLTLLLGIFLVFFVFAEIVAVEGPFEHLNKLIKTELEDATISKLEKFLLKLIETVVTWLTSHKPKVAAISGYSVVWVSKPTRDCTIIYLLGVLVVLSFRSVSVIFHLIIALFLFFYINTQRVEFRALFAVCAAVSLVIYTDLHISYKLYVLP